MACLRIRRLYQFGLGSLLAFTTTVAFVLVAPPVSVADDPRLPATSQRLNVTEVKMVRRAITESGPCTASPRGEWPYPRVLVVPKEIEAAYAKKPHATTRLLLKIVEGGRHWDSIHAVACIEALLWSPECAAITVMGTDEKTWDDPIEKDRETYREFSRLICVRLIVEKETGKEMK